MKKFSQIVIENTAHPYQKGDKVRIGNGKVDYEVVSSMTTAKGEHHVEIASGNKSMYRHVAKLRKVN